MYNFTNISIFNIKSIHEFLSICEVKRRIKIKKFSSDDYYKVHYINGKEHSSPRYILQQIHQKIRIILSEVILPNNIFAPSKKGEKKSNIKNAKYHKNSNYLITIDIKSFYENLKLKHVISFLENDLKIEKNTAHFIGKVLTYKGHIPRGSCISPILSHLVVYKIWKEINEYCEKNQLIFSIYMDDITISSQNQFNFQKAINFVTYQLARFNLKCSTKKIKKYTKNKGKKVTGVIIDKNNRLRVQNKHRIKYIQTNKNTNSSKGLKGYINNIEKDLIK